MLTEERHAALLNELRQKGYAQVNELAQQLGVNPITIRRDFALLEKQGKCIRHPGWSDSGRAGYHPELPYEIKAQRYVMEKQRIGEATLAHISDGDTIILIRVQQPTTLASLLIAHRRLTVVTNDLKIASTLAVNPSITLICTGGIARANVYTLLGSQVEQFLKNVHVDKTFLSADAIHLDGSIANVNLDEVAIKQAMVNAGREVILLADSSKFQYDGFCHCVQPGKNQDHYHRPGIVPRLDKAIA